MLQVIASSMPYLEVTHTLKVLDGQGGLDLLDAMHHRTAYQHVREQEACVPRGSGRGGERRKHDIQEVPKGTET